MGGIRYNLIFFAGIALASIIGMSLIWPLAAPAYNHLLVKAATPFIPQGSTLGFKDADTAIVISFEQHYAGLKRDLSMWIQGYALHFGLILVTGLIIATPGLKLLTRFKYIVIAYFILFIIQLVTILIMARVLSSYGPGPVNLLDNPWQVLFITIGCDLFPVVIWGAISFRHWRNSHRLLLSEQ
jgi:hypothetical protein